jgi:hypothetical protein
MQEMEKSGVQEGLKEEEEDIVDSKGKLFYPDAKTKKLPISQRTSHLRLNLKPPSPLPWERIEPPLDNNVKATAGYYSPVTSRFRTMQSSA